MVGHMKGASAIKTPGTMETTAPFLGVGFQW